MPARRSVTETIHRLAREFSMPAITEAFGLYAPDHTSDAPDDVRVARDLSYGAHERHRLDIFNTGEATAERKPVFVFVHGGGFVGGDKSNPGTPYNDNIPRWAASAGMVGVNITYRLAPDHPWPAGSEDVAAAIDWIIREIGAHGGDPGRIILSGTSAGGAHVAGYLADPRFGAEQKIAGAILLSGIYDMETFDRAEMALAYFGRDESRYPAMSTTKALVETKVPVLVTLAEHDPIEFERQALDFVNAFWERHGHWPNFIRVMGHNHFTTTLHMNTADACLGESILQFVTHRTKVGAI
jgi:acetyl esterase/lipase